MNYLRQEPEGTTRVFASNAAGSHKLMKAPRGGANHKALSADAEIGASCRLLTPVF
jgi:hypothetical protein